MDTFPDARFVRNLIVFEQPARGGYLSRGYELEIPDLGQAPAEILNKLTEELQLGMQGLELYERWQWQLSIEPIPSQILDQYEADTQRCTNEWSRLVRTERVQRFRKRAEAGRLNRQRVFLFRTKALQTRMPSSNRISDWSALLEAQDDDFSQFGEMLARRLAPFGIAVSGLDDAGHYLCIARFLNPSTDRCSDETLLKAFDPCLTLEENCCWSEGSVGTDGQFAMDGNTQSMLVLSRVPEDLYPTTMRTFARLNLSRFRMTVTLQPLSRDRELNALEATMRRLRAKPEKSRTYRDRAALEMNEKRAASLASGLLGLMKVGVAFRLWGDTSRLTDLSALREATVGLRGATVFQPTLPASLCKHFCSTVPGWSWSTYQPYALAVDSSMASMFCPLSVSFKGSSDAPQVLMESENGNPVNLSLFSGNGKSSFPRISVYGGGTGGGKSTILFEIVTQADPHVGATTLIDFGGSLRVAAETRRAQICALRAGTDLCINYLVPVAKPLSPEHSCLVNGVHQVLLDNAPSDCGPKLESFVQTLYADCFEQWSRRDPLRFEQLARRCLAIFAAVGRDVTFDLAWNDLHHQESVDPAGVAALLASFPEQAVVGLLHDPQQRHHLRNLSWAYMDEDLKPTLSTLLDCIRLKARKDVKLSCVVDRLKAASRGGGRLGGLLDGASTYDFSARDQYLDLTYIPEKDPLQKGIACLLAGHIASHTCYGTSRSVRKLFMIDEAATFLRQAPGMDAFTASLYQQARKYNVWLGWAFQNLTDLKSTAAWEPVITNTQAFYLLKQDNAKEIELLRDSLELSRRATDAIASYTSPAITHKPACFTYFERSKPVNCCGTVVCELSREMLYASATDGAHFEERQQALLGAGENYVQRLIELARKNS